MRTSKAKGPTGSPTSEFVPTYDGNDKAPIQDQVRVRIRHPTQGDVVMISTALVRHRTRVGDRVELSREGEVEFARLMLTTCVVEVLGYQGEDLKPIKTAADLLARGEPPLIAEVSNRIGELWQLLESDSRNSGAPRDSAQSETVRSNGVATTAEQSGST